MSSCSSENDTGAELRRSEIFIDSDTKKMATAPLEAASNSETTFYAAPNGANRVRVALAIKSRSYGAVVRQVSVPVNCPEATNEGREGFKVMPHPQLGPVVLVRIAANIDCCTTPTFAGAACYRTFW